MNRNLNRIVNYSMNEFNDEFFHAINISMHKIVGIHEIPAGQPTSRENPFLALKHRTRLVFLRGKPFQDLSFARIRFATLSLLSLSSYLCLSTLNLRPHPLILVSQRNMHERSRQFSRHLVISVLDCDTEF